MSARYRLNVLGDFYVAADCCTLCGVPEAEAPSLFDSDGEQCFVKRQPVDASEVEQMLNVLYRQELGCVRYGGWNPSILRTIRSWEDHLDIVDAPKVWQEVAHRLGRRLPGGRDPV